MICKMLDSTILNALKDAMDGGDGGRSGQLSGLITAANQPQTSDGEGLTNYRAMPGPGGPPSGRYLWTSGDISPKPVEISGATPFEFARPLGMSQK